MYYRVLPLNGLVNARDLGGYATKSGGVTKFGRFIRHEVPVGLTESDLVLLKEYNVTDSIDLRSTKEATSRKSELASVPWIHYSNIAMDSRQAASGAAMRIEEFVRWGEFYIRMTDKNDEWLRSVLTTMAEAPGAVMFNCTTGKDRTGIISALLLGLAGVSDEDIIADYCLSQVYMRSKYLELCKTLPPMMLSDGTEWEYDLDHPFFQTSPDNMAVLLNHLYKNYGNIEGFIKNCGISDEIIEKLRQKLAF